MKRTLGLLVVVTTLLVTGCAKKTPFDYSAFNESKPASILVLPPVNSSPEVKASHSILSTATRPLAEAGYYVFPVTTVEETFAQNGLTDPHDIQNVSIQKLHQIFGADAALYMSVIQYGTSYQVVNSVTRVAVAAKLVDLRTGKQLWGGSASASSDESNSNNTSGNVLGILIAAAVNQVVSTISDESFDMGAKTNSRLLSATGNDGAILYGPRSPNYANKH